MNTIAQTVKTEYIIQKSKFITILYHVTTEEDISSRLELAKKQYKDATHYCYAYIINTTKRFSDDGEPGGTAGIPILHALETNHYNHILAIVIRYFGGIKLGSGGLVRAYTKAVTEALAVAQIKKEVIGMKIQITFSYDNVKKVDYTLEKNNIIEKTFNENITYIFTVSNDAYHTLLDILKPIILNYNIIEQNVLL